MTFKRGDVITWKDYDGKQHIAKVLGTSKTRYRLRFVVLANGFITNIFDRRMKRAAVMKFNPELYHLPF